jgi:hypothetical protein
LKKKAPFVDGEDPRFQWLLDNFLPWIEEWNGADSDSFLTKETYEALRITTLGTVGLVQQLLDSGFSFVLTRRLTSDNIERLFSSMRQSNGGNFHMETKAAASALQKRLKTGIIKASKFCNVGSDTEQQIDFKLIPTTKSTKEKSASQVLDILPRTTMEILAELDKTPGK